jgi:hypothetical protein
LQQLPEAHVDEVWHIAPGPPQVLFGPQVTRLPPSTTPQHSSHAPWVEQGAPSGRQHWFWSSWPIGPHATAPSQPSVHCSALVQFSCRAGQTQAPQVPSQASQAPTQAPPLQVAADAHTRQASPPLPHAPLAPPPLHVVPSQQPAQLWASQTHVPLAHRWPVAHELQTSPLLPQAPLVPPPLHVVPSQQPAQLSPSQGTTWDVQVPS